MFWTTAGSTGSKTRPQAVAGPSSDSALSAAIHDRTQKMLASAADGGQTAARRLHEEIGSETPWGSAAIAHSAFRNEGRFPPTSAQLRSKSLKFIRGGLSRRLVPLAFSGDVGPTLTASAPTLAEIGPNLARNRPTLGRCPSNSGRRRPHWDECHARQIAPILDRNDPFVQKRPVLRPPPGRPRARVVRTLWAHHWVGVVDGAAQSLLATRRCGMPGICPALTQSRQCSVPAEESSDLHAESHPALIWAEHWPDFVGFRPSPNYGQLCRVEVELVACSIACRFNLMGANLWSTA